MAERRSDYRPPAAPVNKPEPQVKAFTSPLYEAAAAHDKQPAEDWMELLYRVNGWRR